MEIKPDKQTISRRAFIGRGVNFMLGGAAAGAGIAAVTHTNQAEEIRQKVLSGKPLPTTPPPAQQELGTRVVTGAVIGAGVGVVAHQALSRNPRQEARRVHEEHEEGRNWEYWRERERQNRERERDDGHQH